MALFDVGANFPLTDREVLDLRGLTSSEVRALGAVVKYRFVLLEV